MIARSYQEALSIIERVYSGEVDPADVTKRAGGEPDFTLTADKRKNLVNSGRWPALIAIAAIMSRNVEAGVNSWLGYAIEPVGLVRQPEWHTAQLELRSMLAAEKVEAWGINTENLRRVKIPPAKWDDLTITQYKQVALAARCQEEPRYLDVWVDAEATRKQLHLAKGVGIEKVEATIADETDCKRALVRLMKANPDHPIPKSESRKNFPKVSARGFDRVYAKAVLEAHAPAWSAPGPRTKKSKRP